MRTVFLLFWAIPCFVFAKEQSSVTPKQFELHLGIDKDGGFIPSFRLPFHWNSKLSSTVRFSQSMNTESVPMLGFTGSKMVQASVQEIGMTLLSIHLGSGNTCVAIGGGVHYKRISRYEFGVFDFPGVKDDVPFDNRSDFRLVSPTIEGDVWLKWSKINLDIHTQIKPVNILFYEQDLLFLFDSTHSTNLSDDYTVQGPIVALTVAPYINMVDLFWVGLWGHCDYMKISYERNLLIHHGGTNFSFATSETSFSELTLYAEGRLAFPRFSVLGTTPFLGGGVKYIREEMGSDSESGTIPYFTFGLEVF